MSTNQYTPQVGETWYYYETAQCDDVKSMKIVRVDFPHGDGSKTKVTAANNTRRITWPFDDFLKVFSKTALGAVEKEDLTTVNGKHITRDITVRVPGVQKADLIHEAQKENMSLQNYILEAIAFYRRYGVQECERCKGRKVTVHRNLQIEIPCPLCAGAGKQLIVKTT